MAATKSSITGWSWLWCQVVPPPLVGGAVGGDGEGRVRRRRALRQEARALGEEDVGGVAAGVGRERRELVEPQLAPGVGAEPLRLVAAGAVQGLQQAGH